MKTIRMVAAVAMAGMALTAFAAENNTFTVLHKDKPAGKCVYSIEKTKKGYAVKSKVGVKAMSDASTTDQEGKASGVSDTQQTAEYKLDDNMNLVEAFVILTDQASRTNTSFVPDKAGTKLTVQRTQQGVAGDASDVPLRPGFLVAPEYDASVLQVLLLRAMTHPLADKMYYIVTPSKRGTPSATSAQWTAVADTEGVLNGKPVTVHHYTVLMGKQKYEIYGDDANLMMMAKAGSNTYIREGFEVKAKEKSAD